MAKILFIQNWYVDYQAIGVLSACLKRAGHSAELLITSPEKIVDKIISYTFDVIGFSVITGERGLILKMIEKLRNAGIKAPITVGGLDAIFNSEYWNEKSGADIICIGEGERAIVELLDAIERKSDYKSLKNFWVKEKGITYKNKLLPILTVEDLNKLPDFDYKIFENYYGVPFIAYMCGRGCPYSCAYCFNHAYRNCQDIAVKQYCRMRDPGICIEEICRIKTKYIDNGKKERYIYFIDSTSLYDKKWAIEFFTLFKEKVGLKYSINACINEIDEDISKLLKDTGCTLIRFGLESGDEEFRMNVLNKKITNETFVKNLAILNRDKVKYQISILMGFPYETIDNAFNTIKFCQEINHLYTWGVNLYTAYPESDIAKRALKDRLIDPDYNEKLNQQIYHYNKTLVRTPDIDKISNLQKLAYVAIVFPFTFPLIKKLVYLKPNKIYNLILDISYIFMRAWIFKVSNMVKYPLLSVIKYSIQNITIRFKK